MIKYLIHRPVAVTMILIALVVIGIVGIKNIPVSLFCTWMGTGLSCDYLKPVPNIHRIFVTVLI